MYTKLMSCFLAFVFFAGPFTPLVQAKTQISLGENCLAPVSELSTRDIARAINKKNLKAKVEAAYSQRILQKFKDSVAGKQTTDDSVMNDTGFLVLGVIAHAVFWGLYFSGLEFSFSALNVSEKMLTVLMGIIIGLPAGAAAVYLPVKIAFSIVKSFVKLLLRPFRYYAALSALNKDKEMMSAAVAKIYRTAAIRLDKEVKEVKVPKNAVIDADVVESFLERWSGVKNMEIKQRFEAYLAGYENTVNQADIISFIDSMYYEQIVEAEAAGKKSAKDVLFLNELRRFVLHRAVGMKHATWQIVLDDLKKSYNAKLEKLNAKLKTDLSKANVYTQVKKYRDKSESVPYTAKRFVMPKDYYDAVAAIRKRTEGQMKTTSTKWDKFNASYNMDVAMQKFEEQHREEEEISDRANKEISELEERYKPFGKYEDYTDYKYVVVGQEEYFVDGPLDDAKTLAAHQKIIDASKAQQAKLKQDYDALTAMINASSRKSFEKDIIDGIFASKQAQFFFPNVNDFVKDIIRNTYHYDTFMGFDFLKEDIRQKQLLAVSA